MLVVIAIAALAVLVGVFLAATGRGGELAYEQIDHAPLDLGPVSPPDVALLRPPTALWGYNVQVTDEALDHIARAIRERDITIAYLQQELANREPSEVAAAQAGVAPTTPDVFRPLADPDARQFPAGFSPAGFSPPGPAFDAPPGPAPLGPAPTDLAPTDPALAWPALAGPADPVSAGPAASTAPDASTPPRSLRPPGVLVAHRPQEAVQPSEATQPSEPTQPHDTTLPSETLPTSYETLGPQGPYDTHDWWAEQEEAAREEAQRQADAQHAVPTSPREAPASRPSAFEPATAEHGALEPATAEHGALEPATAEPATAEPSAVEPSAVEPSAVEPSAVEPSELPDGFAADQADTAPTRTDTVPNPAMTSPSEAGAPPHAGQPPTGSSKPLTPRDDALAAAEEQAR